MLNVLVKEGALVYYGHVQLVICLVSSIILYILHIQLVSIINDLERSLKLG